MSRTVRFIARRIATRIALGILMLLVVSAVVFFCTQALPGDIARQILGQNATPEQIEALRAELGLDQPVLVQYGSWLMGMLQLDPGTSLASHTPASNISSAVKPFSLRKFGSSEKPRLAPMPKRF
jgi:peptide/nickel transport system permease protein